MERALMTLQIIWKKERWLLKPIDRLFISFLFIILIAPSIAGAGEALHPTTPMQEPSDCIVELAYGSINWTTGVIRAKGIGSSDKRGGAKEALILKAARNSARDHLIEILNVIGLPDRHKISKTVVQTTQSTPPSADTTQSIHTIVAQMKKKAMGAKVAEIRHLSNQTVEVIVETNMHGDFLQSVLPPAIREIPEIELFEPDSAYQESAQPESTLHTDEWENGPGVVRREKSQSVSSYTGIIIDARDIGFKPVIAPIIVSEQGEEIYSPLFVTRKYAVERGVCTYICSLNPAIIAQKVGSNPVTIKGLRKDSDRNYSIVISMADADKIQRMAERHLFMKRCQVIIVISP